MSKFLNSLKKENNTASLPFLILAVSIFLTTGITYSFYQSAKNKDTLRFNSEADRLHLAIENKLNLYIALLKGGRGFVESNREVTRENFSEYVKSLELENNYTGIEGIGYVKVVAADEREALVKKMNAEGFSDFVLPLSGKVSEKETSQIVIYLEPSTNQNQQMIGFDIASEPNRREALNRARDSGEAASSAKIDFIQKSDSNKQSGFLIFLPIYKNGKSPATIEERAKNISGYIYSPFKAAEFVESIQNGKFGSDVSFKIYDGEPSAENLLVQNGETQISAFSEQLDERYATQNALNVAGRKWFIRYESSRGFTAQSSVGWTPLIFLAGIVFSFLLFGMTYWETSARIKLQKTAGELFEIEQQKQGLLEKEHAARLSAERANNTKDEFIAVVSHELRTPLNSIAGWLRILKTDDLSENTKKLALEKIEKNLRSQTGLVEQLLDYSQIVSGTVKLEEKEISFSKVFENTFAEIEPTAQEKNIEFTKNNQLNGKFISGDENKIALAIYNLLTNAIKFTHSGGRVEALAIEQNDSIKLIIKDNGIGISPDFLPHVFDRFMQVDTSSTRHSGGLGLGLTISNHIITLHNGTIEAASEGLGKGSEFIIKLPIKH